MRSADFTDDTFARAASDAPSTSERYLRVDDGLDDRVEVLGEPRAYSGLAHSCWDSALGRESLRDT